MPRTTTSPRLPRRPDDARPDDARPDDARKEPPASIESDKDPRDNSRDREGRGHEGEGRRVGPEDEDRRLRDGEKRPDGQMP